MMNKNKSANVHLMRFLFILPLLVVVLLAFRSVAISNNQNLVKKITDTIPAAPVDVDDVFKKKGIKEITIKASDKKNKKAYVTFKNGTTKVFDLTNEEEREAFEAEYGDVTPPAPPVAPRPAKASAHRVPPAPAATPDGPPAPPTPVPAQPAAPGAAPVPTTPAAAPKRVAGFRAPGTVSIVESATSASAAPIEVSTTVQATGRIKVGRPPMTEPVEVSINEPVEVRVQGTKSQMMNVQGTGSINKRTMVTADVIEIRPITAVNVTGTATIAEETELLVEIKNTTTRQELEQLTAALKQKGYTFTLNNASFDNGELVAVEGSISNAGGKGNFSGDHFKTLTISVNKGDGKQFYIAIRGGSVSFQ